MQGWSRKGWPKTPHMASPTSEFGGARGRGFAVIEEDPQRDWNVGHRWRTNSRLSTGCLVLQEGERGIVRLEVLVECPGRYLEVEIPMILVIGDDVGM